jgi:hypothetical protein
VLPLRATSLLALVGGLSSCGKSVGPGECSALLDRYVEKLVGSDRPGVSAGDLVRLQAEARATAQNDPAFRDCPKVVSRRQMDCAMRAETVDRMEICLN